MISQDLLKGAICNNDIPFLEKMSSNYKIDERLTDEDNDTLLLYAISDDSSNAYRYLLEKGANVTLINNKGEGILHAIVYSGDVFRLTEIINYYHPDINSQAYDGCTPLLLAISLNKANMAHELIRLGADVNVGDKEGISPLHIAVQDSDITLASKLIGCGANVFQKTAKGNVPMAFAANSENLPMIDLLYTAYQIARKLN